MIKEKDLPEGWKIVKLKDVAVVDSGQGAPQGEKWYDGNNIFVRAGDLNNLTEGKYVGDYSQKINDTAIRKYNLKKYPANCVVFPKSGMSVKTDNIALLKYDSYVVNHLAILQVIKKGECSAKYLYYLLKKTRISNLSYNESYPSIRLQDIKNYEIPLPLQDIKNYEIPLPPLPTQKKIVSILEKAEKLKELRKEADKLTDDYLKSVFLEMFGDPGRNEKGWETKNFLEIFNITTGKLNSNAAVESGKYPFFTCSKNTFRIDRYSFDCEALLLSGNNASGEYSVKHYNGKFDAYQRTYVLTFKNAENSYRFFHFLLEKKLEELRSRSIGTNTKYLTLGILKWINLIVPPIELQNKFAEIVKQVEKMREYQKQSGQQIEDLFNALMQKAFRGELVC